MGWRASDGQNGVCMRFDELILPRLSASATSGYYVILQNSTAPAIPQLRLAQNNYPTHFCIFLRAITFPVPLSLFRVSTAHSILQLSSCLIPPYRCHTSLPSRHIKAHALRPCIFQFFHLTPPSTDPSQYLSLLFPFLFPIPTLSMPVLFPLHTHRPRPYTNPSLLFAVYLFD